MPYDPPATRLETHFNDRLIRCFVQRPPSVNQMLADAARQHPATEALVSAQTRLTYAELDEQVACVAGGLQRAGLRQGERLVLFCGNRAEFVITFFACQRLGVIAVPVSTREQADGLHYVLQQCAASAVLIEPELRDRLNTGNDSNRFAGLVIDLPALDSNPPQAVNASRADASAPARHLCWQALTAAAPLSQAATTKEEDTAVLLYTSGTTGKPKGAMLSHLGIAHSVEHFRVGMGLPSGVRCALAVPASHVTGLVAIIATAVHCAGTIVVMASFKANAFLQLCARERINYTLMVPAMYKLCLLDPDFEAVDLRHWQIGGFGGAPMPESTIDELARRLPALALMNAYGATETTSPATMMPTHLTRDHLDSVGLAVPCGQLLVVDDDGCEVAPGETGELWIGGPMIVRGYWDNPQASAAEFTGGFWHSGDLGSIDADGFVRIFDRKKDMINRGGYKIFSVEVENFLVSIAGVMEAAAVGKPCPVLGERVHAFVCVSDPAIAADTLQALCRQHLADYKVPESIRIGTEPLPRNANGKVLKRLLRERLLAD